MRPTLPLAALLALASPAVAVAQGPSFDCARAATADELTICADPQLSELDLALASAYAQAHRIRPRIAQAIARNGLAARHGCQADRACILQTQMALIGRYQQLGAVVEVPAWAADGQTGLQSGADVIPEPPLLPSEGGSNGGLPQQVGQCASTTVATITDRFGDDVRANPDSGSAVTFANGGTQVSYDKVDALIESEVGDPVLMCLIFIPQDCPPGDERGRVYTTTNLRTQQSWSLPDSQHSCGGA